MTRKANPHGIQSAPLNLGLEGAEELSAKVVLAAKLNDLIDKRSLIQADVATITGMTQPKVSQLRRYKLQSISLESLIQALVSLGQHVKIVVQPARCTHIGAIVSA